MQQRLIEMGDWLKVNGEAIYGTRCAVRPCQWSNGTRPTQEYGEFKVKYDLMEQVGPQAEDGRAVKQFFFTKKPDALYAITTGWLAPELTIRKVKVPTGSKVTLLGVKEPLTFRTVGDDLIVQVPRLMPQELPCQCAWTLKMPGTELLPE